MPYAPVNGIQLYYEVHGEGPSTIVFAHGAGGNHLSWFQQIPFFSKRYRCITFSHRRFHLSPDLPDGPGPAAFVEDLATLLDHLGVRDAALVAQSMGGGTCFGFARAYPHRVKALVMADTTGGIPSARIRDTAAALTKERLEKGIPRWRYSASFEDREPGLCFLYNEIERLNDGFGSTQLAAMLRPPPTDADLRKFKVPLLFLNGSEDVLCPPKLARLAHKLIPGSRYVEVEGAGHSVYFEKADEFNRIVAEFMEDVGV